MPNDDLSRALLQRLSKATGTDGKLNDESIRRMFASHWDDEVTLAVMAEGSPPEVSKVLLRRVRQLAWPRKIKVLAVYAAIAFGIFVYVQYFAK
jgi:hypothetical protein